MKRNRYIISLFFIMAGVMFSCEDYLNIPLEAEISKEEVFGTYASFQGFQDQLMRMTVDYNRHGPRATNALGGEGVSPSGQTIYKANRGDYRYVVSNRGVYANAEGNYFQPGLYDSFWSNIRMANMCLEQLESGLLVEATDDERDWLKGQADSIFTEVSRNRFKKPWHARNNYIDCFNGQLNIDSFLAEQSGYDMKESEKIVALKLLQMQRHAMLMYTSCGWFFNDISGIETEQILSYAGRVIQLAEELSSKKLEPKFLTLLALAKSNVPERENGAQIYKQVIKKSRMNFSTLCAHYALNRLIDLCDNKETLYSNRIELLDFHNFLNNQA